jgi:Holliday junction resolvasome RuvABC endonuclease subunit
MKETMLKRIPLMMLLAVQAIGGGAITLAHARDVVVAPPGFEASHNARCAILHDELRCALCQYASARVVTQQVFTLTTPQVAIRVVSAQPVVVSAAFIRLTAPARAPPPFFSS